MKFAKLIMITQNNNNKEYIMTQINSDTFKAEYGRVGQNYQTTTYPISNWDKKYREKTKKGYKDVTELVEKVDQDGDSIKLPYDYITNKSIRDVLNRLYKYTDTYLKENYLISSNEVSKLQIDKAYEIIDEIEELITKSEHTGTLYINTLNDKLIELYETIPRRMSNVKSNLFSDTSTLNQINEKIKSELETLKTMSDTVELRHKKIKENKKLSQGEELNEEQQQEKLLNDLGLVIEDTTDEDIKFIKKQLGESSNLFKKAWKVTNKTTQENFNKLIKSKEYKDTKIAHYWHGSRNQNWYNIIQTGLVTNPKGVKITGKMFGKRIVLRFTA